jgi:hypothetical protein
MLQRRRLELSAFQHNLGAQVGVMYLALLLFIALTSVAGLKVAQAFSFQIARDVEQDLLSAGREFKDAIGTYYESSPGTLKVYPATFDDLVKDERFLGVRRHMRKIRIDPATRKADWIIIKAIQGGIQGVMSASDKKPIQKINFQAGEIGFENADTYQDWKFVYIPVVSGKALAAPIGQTSGQATGRKP